MTTVTYTNKQMTERRDHSRFEDVPLDRKTDWYVGVSDLVTDRMSFMSQSGPSSNSSFTNSTTPLCFLNPVLKLPPRTLPENVRLFKFVPCLPITPQSMNPYLM